MINEQYLKDLQHAIMQLFNQPIEEQPDAVVHIGCGEGVLFHEVYTIINKQSSRGENLNQYPLTFIGLDTEERFEEAFKKQPFKNVTTQFALTTTKDLVRNKEILETNGVQLHNKILWIHTPTTSEVYEKEYLKFIASLNKDNDYLLVTKNTDTVKFIETAAEHGLFTGTPSKIYKDNSDETGIHHLKKRTYSIRNARLKDIDALWNLEKLCWTENIRSTKNSIKNRIKKYPEGQFVLEKEEKVLGVIYSQRIADKQALNMSTMDNVHLLHTNEGAFIQLLAVNIHPEVQFFNYGDQLLEFMLQRSTLIKGISEIVAVSICKNYDNTGELSIEEYIQLEGAQQDPIMAFHKNHGAQIAKALPNYRERDIANNGFGVLVEYKDLPNRWSSKTTKLANSAVNTSQLTNKKDITEFVTNSVANLLNTNSKSVDLSYPLMEMGLNSVDLQLLQRQLEKEFHKTLEPGFFFEYNNLTKVINYLVTNTTSLVSKEELKAPQSKTPTVEDSDIAIVGISCKLPGGIETLDDLWNVLVAGESKIGTFPKERGRWPKEAEYMGISKGGFMKDADAFDASFFRISPKEATITDPQQRILLELAWASLEDAGIVPKDLVGSDTGVFVGASNTDYSRKVQDAKLEVAAHNAIGSSLAVLANRLSYYFDFSGPSMLIDTACSSSLVAIHSAVKSLQLGECSVAMVGGVNLICHPDLSVAYHKAGMLSPDGSCKVFDNKANGYVRSEGAVVMILKPLQQAMVDNNQIHGVIKGSSSNHGGLAAGLTVPNPQKQSELLVAAWKNAKIKSTSISYIEAHGTGTSLGDPIEVQGIKSAFSKFDMVYGAEQCSIGSIKSNLGHLESAAGMVGMLKVILAMKHQQLPATINYKKLNSKINLTNSPLRIQETLQPWQQPTPLTAGVSSFGSGGANAHVVLQEYATNSVKSKEQEKYLFVLSALHKEQLEVYAEKIHKWLRVTDLEDFGQAIYTWQVARTPMNYRLAIQVENQKDLEDKLAIYISGVEHQCIWESVQAISEADKKDIDSLLLSKVTKDGFTENNIEELARSWVSGTTIYWKECYRNFGDDSIPMITMSLPTYPFAKEKYWIQEEDIVEEELNTVVYATPIWKQQEVVQEEIASYFDRRSVLLCNYSRIKTKEITDLISDVDCQHIISESKDSGKQFIEITKGCFQYLKSLLESKPKGKTLVQIVIPSDEQTLLEGISGLLRTLHIENPLITGQVISTELPLSTTQEVAKLLLQNGTSSVETEVKYHSNQRYIKHWTPVTLNASSKEIPFKEEGVYLITGGLGGLGVLFIKEIVKQANDTQIIVTGRSALTSEKKEVLENLKQLHQDITYYQADVSVHDEITELIATIQEKHGTLNGLLHCAGFIKDSFIRNKTIEDFEAVLKPKVLGAEYIDKATKNMSLDFFVLFSSVFSVLGNAGQIDYATANGFMDQFAKHRNTKVTRGERSGKTFAVNWPFWEEGGMHIDTINQNIIFETTGMLPLQTTNGIEAFYKALASKHDQVLVMEGAEDKLITTLEGLTVVQGRIEEQFTAETNDDVFETTLQKIKEVFAEVLGLSVGKVDENELFVIYGVDSIFINQLNQKLAKLFGAISKTLFFEYQTLNELTEYLVQEYPQVCATWGGAKTNSVKQSGYISGDSKKSFSQKRGYVKEELSEREPIAIIGISGMYPEAKNLEEFWNNLKEGKNSITEIPSLRWSMEDFFEPDVQKAVKEGKSYSKWGGFIEEFAQFDPLFFGISPREAQNIDPQERLFLQEAWRALESSGYTKTDLKEKYAQKVGVFAGVTKSGFELKAPFYAPKDPKFHPRSSFSSIANRLSYVLDIKGPSMPVDTMCSSSLTAIHEACEHIYNNECAIAFAGGVNLYLHPSTYSYLSSQHMLSVDGQCKSFGLGGNGFVPGEGVGVVLLKRLSEAVKDNDTIHGVILGTHVNHGGKTNGYTVPSPTSQAELIQKTIERAGIQPEDISYIEAHGTGTELGDPIEIEGLKKAFEKGNLGIEVCNIGSVKSNIGHLEAAAGISGVTKVLLQMKHGKIAPSLHASELNPNIDFNAVPFKVVNQLKDWNRPKIDNQEKPRIAGISSFGAGGSNAHILIQEYQPITVYNRTQGIIMPEEVLVPLSAKNTEQLETKASQLLEFLKNHQESEVTLHNIAYTLQVGREPMEQRVGFVVTSLEELKEKLQQYINNEQDIENCDQGNKKHPDKTFVLFRKEFEFQQTVSKWIADKKLLNLLMLWVNGLDINWSLLYESSTEVKRISLPTYPFAKDEYWVQTEKGERGLVASKEVAYLHPILHRNTSSIFQQNYTANFIGNERFFRKNKRKNNKVEELVFSELAALEMAIAAALDATGSSENYQQLALRNIQWSNPYTARDANEISIALSSNIQSVGVLDFDIYSKIEGEEKIHCQGEVEINATKQIPLIKLEEAIANLTEREVSDKNIESIYIGTKEVIAQLRLPEEIKNEKELIFSPKLADVIAEVATYTIPEFSELTWFSVQDVLVSKDLEEEIYVKVSTNEEKATGEYILDVVFFNKKGENCLAFYGAAFGKTKTEIVTKGDEVENFIFTPSWSEISEISTNSKEELLSAKGEFHIILLDTFKSYKKVIEKNLKGVHCISITSEEKEIAAWYTKCAIQCFEYIQQLQKNKSNQKQYIQIVVPNEGEQKVLAGLTGLLRTTFLENPSISGQLFLTDTSMSEDALLTQIQSNFNEIGSQIIKYEAAKRYVFEWKRETSTRSQTEIPFKEQGVYVITGGLGGLGIKFCKEILEQVHDVTVVLIGRSALTEAKKQQLAKISNGKAKVIYKQLEVSNKKAVTEFVNTIITEHKQLNGILHCAGMIADRFIADKTIEEFTQVLQPKVHGVSYLDIATQHLELDFMVLFSSISGAIGFVGQADYSSANGFMDQFAHYRNSLVSSGNRKGKTLAINWPLWKDGGMNVDDATKEMVKQTIGMHGLEATVGIQAFYRSLELGASQSLVVSGVPQQLEKHIDGFKATKVLKGTKKNELSTQNEDSFYTKEELQKAVKTIVSEILEIQVNAISLEQTFIDMGLNSILGVELAVAINKKFGTTVSNVIVYDCPTVKEMADYLCGIAVKPSEKLGASLLLQAEVQSSQETIHKGYPTLSRKTNHTKGRPVIPHHKNTSSSENTLVRGEKDERIAIIGMSGKYPMAENLEMYWNNLENGVDAVVEIPNSRWDIDAYYDADPDKEGKIYCKWMGMLDGVDEFDPLFFKISPQEAVFMDPEHRLFLQESYRAFEDAGYSSNLLKNQKCGVYLGLEQSEYTWHLNQNKVTSPNVTTNNSAIAAARIAYFLNLKGPAITIDTACSSSLVAIHLACKALLNNEINMALTGGVRLWLGPETYTGLCQAKMLSPDGRCKTFDDSANGFVPGEGVGALVLKRLQDAEADGDNILGVILGSGINQDGKTNGITAPSVKSQIALEQDIYTRHHIDPATISYVETHGTGTKLGDPIELEALSTVFSKYNTKNNYCALGSVKSNIGHTTAAAGIAGVHKVLLAIKNKTLAPSLHVKNENSHFDFKNSPFYVNKEKRVWETENNTLRRASVSSFGFSGTNSHLVIEEYPSTEPEASTSSVIIPLSARTSEQLKEKAKDLLHFIGSHRDGESVNLVNMAYTLQTGRDAMKERLGFIVSSVEELEENLSVFVSSDTLAGKSFRGTVKPENETLSLFSTDSDLKEALGNWMLQGKQEKLLKLWVTGLTIDWEQAYQQNKPKRISLPTYPFARERYWVQGGQEQKNKKAVGVEYLHPLVHKNTSNLSKQSFTSVFSGEEFFLKDHLVNEFPILPGVAYLEMVREAMKLSVPTPTEDYLLELTTIFWIRPLKIEKRTEVEIVLTPLEDEAISFEIYSRNEGESELHCQGEASLILNEEWESLNITELQEKAIEQISAKKFYDFFASTGVNYGPSFQGINKAIKTSHGVLAELSLPNVVASNTSLGLHPSILDSALQSCVALITDISTPSKQALLPYALDSLTVLRNTEAQMYAYVELAPEENFDSSVKKLNIILTDTQGNICVKISGFSARFLENTNTNLENNKTITSTNHSIDVGLQYLVPTWSLESEIKKETIASDEKVVVIGTENSRLAWLQESFSNAEFLQIATTATINEIKEQCKSLKFNQLIWVAPSEENSKDVIKSQEEGVLQLFRITKALLELNYGEEQLQFTIITTNTQKVTNTQNIAYTHAGVIGFVGSLAKEYEHWKLRLLDIDYLDDLTAKDCLSMPCSVDGNPWVYRDGSWFSQTFAKTQPQENKPLYKQHGVYVVIGGAGGLGEIWSQYMIKNYQATIIWIGRSALNDSIKEKQQQLQALGKAPLYIQSDATDENSLKEAYQKIQEQYKTINGVVHSAIVLKDQTVLSMNEERFKESLSAKVDVSVQIEKVFGNLELDFILFFSSLTSFVKAAGQSNYAAGCTFKDSFAHSLHQRKPYTVKTINWSYWGNIGIVSNTFYQERMEKNGIGSIEANEGMKALEFLMGASFEQMALHKILSKDGITNAHLKITDTLKLYNQQPEVNLSFVSEEVEAKNYKEELKELAEVQLPSILNELATEIIVASLTSVGLLINGTFKLSDLKKNNAPASFLERWLTATISYLQQENWITSEGDIAKKPRELENLWQVWSEHKNVWNSNKNWKNQVVLLETCLKALPGILTGKQIPTDVIFPNSSLHLVEGVYKGNFQVDFYNEILCNSLRASITEVLKTDKNKEIRILEVGAGTGGTTTKVIPVLKEFDNAIVEYCYTDLSKAFLIHAEENYQPQFPNLKTAIFNVSKPVAGQDVTTNYYDIIIATNVLHATPNIRQTMRNTKALLKDQGIVLINEMSIWSLFTHAIFGLLEGWWLYEDESLRIKGSPGLTPENWEKVLTEEGFEQITMPLSNSHQFGQQIVMAVSNGEVLQQITTSEKSTLPVQIKKQKTPPITKEKESLVLNESGTIREKCTLFFKELIGKALKIKQEQIEAGESLENYGLDSIMVVQLTNQFRKVFPDVTSTLFFEERTVEGLVNYFLSYKKEAVEELFKNEKDKTVHVEESTIKSSSIATSNAKKSFQILPRTQIGVKKKQEGKPSKFDVAIVGVSGRYPKSSNINEFWKHLVNGENCITEIPEDRWNWETYFDTEKGKSGKIYTKWGGFLDGIDEFDPLFFKISPKEAKKMDPQERLFLQTCYHAIEDAGYTPQNLSTNDKIGVFAGVMNSRYTPQSLHYSLANRVSYTFNFQGPSMAVDTACSSSLTAIHLALESMYNGTVDCAIAGGVNIIIDAEHYVQLSEMTMLSEGNKCKAFGANADGFVDSEGVGAIILKPLYKAEEDGDHIYAVIKGSAINAGGKTNGYTVPNPKAQSAVVTKALANANINKEDVSYIEAHGTGTALGDPIEVSALTRALQTENQKRFCAIGSVKSNIGHCESAAGIAGLTKVILQLQHKKLVPSLHTTEINPEINFEQTPFLLQRKVSEWKQPQRIINGQTLEIPRIAGISSFGAGGANAHIIAEEYVAPKSKVVHIADSKVAIILSARTTDQLQEKAQQLLTFVVEADKEVKQLDLLEIAYTLQVGREALEVRFATIVTSISELVKVLKSFIAKPENNDLYTVENTKEHKENTLEFKATANYNQQISSWISQKNYAELVAWWTKGIPVNWELLYTAGTPKRISLPHYPFAKERYWKTPISISSEGSMNSVNFVMHPLLHSNTSDILQTRFSSSFKRTDALIHNYEVQNTKALPFSVTIELIREAVNRGLPLKADNQVLELKDVNFGEIIAVNETKDLHISLFGGENTSVNFEIHGNENEEVYVQGEATFVDADFSIVPLEAIQNQISGEVVPGEEVYNQLAKDGIQYGSSYKGIQSLTIEKEQVLAHISIPAEIITEASSYELHPTILESSIQTATFLAVKNSCVTDGRIVPMSVGNIQVVSATTKEMYVWVQTSPVQYENAFIVDVDLYDSNGNLSIHLEEVSFEITEKIYKANHTQNVQLSTINSPVSEPRLEVPREVLFSYANSGKIALTDIESAPIVQNLKKPTGIVLETPEKYNLEKEAISSHHKKVVLSSHQSIIEKNTDERLVRLFDTGKGIFKLQIQAPQFHNSLNTELMEQLIKGLEAAAKENSLKVLIVSGTSETFLQGSTHSFSNTITKQLLQKIISFPYPVIAVLEGNALGAGFLLGALADFMICNEAAYYGYTDIENRIYPIHGEYDLLAERFGTSIANDFLLTSNNFTGKELKAKGWTLPVLEATELAHKAEDLAEMLASKPQKTLQLLKKHLARHLVGKVNELKPISLKEFKAEQVSLDALNFSTLSFELVKENILKLTIKLLTENKVETLVKELKTLLTIIDTTNYTIILTSENDNFIPENISEEQVLNIKNSLLFSTCPIITVLEKGSNSNGWFLSLFGDAVLYAEEASYTAKNILENSVLGSLATTMFTQYFGAHLSKEILLSETSCNGRELKLLNGTVKSVALDSIENEALKLATFWTALPVTVVKEWKQQRLLVLKKSLEATPIYKDLKEEKDTTLQQGIVPLRTEVVKATVHAEGIIEVVLESRASKNMFTEAFIEGVQEVFNHIKENPHYKVVLLTGYDNYFASGGTKEGLVAIQEGKSKFTDAKIYQLAMECEIPVIALMQGHAIGGGWSLGMFADFVFFSKERKYISPYLNYGFTPGAGATFIFPQTLGYDLAKEILFTATEFSGSDLQAKGLPFPVLAKDKIKASAMNLAKQLAKRSRTVLIAFKKCYTQHLLHQIEPVYQLELAMHEQTFVGRKDTLNQIEQHFIHDHNQTKNDVNKAIIPKKIEQKEMLQEQINSRDILITIKKFLAQELHMDANIIEEDIQFVDLGMDSITGVTWVRKINNEFKTHIEATKVYSYPTLRLFSEYVKDEVVKNVPLVEKKAVIEEKRVSPVSLQEKTTVVKEEISLQEIKKQLKTFLAKELHMEVSQVDEETQFIDLGMDSITGVTWVRSINNAFKTTIEATKIYSYPTIKLLSEFIKSELERLGLISVNNTEEQPVKTTLVLEQVVNKQNNKRIIKNSHKLTSWRTNKPIVKEEVPTKKSRNYGSKIAVIGIAGQFPKAKNVTQFWDNIATGKNCISEVAESRWSNARYFQKGEPKPGKTNSKWMGALEDYDKFDPLFFNISPVEAESMDPQQRLFLQACWHGIEDAGYSSQELSGSKCGVFVGCGAGDYHDLSKEHRLSAQGFTGGSSSILAARISYLLNLQGPCLSIDTACSSSLVALGTACDNLMSGNCDVALAGGVGIMATPAMHIMTAQAGMLSQDGKCYTFDQKANGFVPGEAVGVVMLKRLEDAEKDNDTIYGIIEGWGVNQDGKTNGITAPNAVSQANLEKEVYQKFGINPAEIQLIEAHGTGTKLGDPIEVDALKQAFSSFTQETEFCALGSVKSNIGHCMWAAGIAGFIKVVLSLKYKKLPPTINFTKLNEHINLEGSPFYVNNTLQDWQIRSQEKRRGAISSFGFSGTNALVIVGEYETVSEIKKVDYKLTDYGILLSAKNQEQLQQKAVELQEYLQSTDVSVEELAYTLQVGREALEERVGFHVANVSELASLLNKYIAKEEHSKIYRGTTLTSKQELLLFVQDEDLKETVVQKWITENKLAKLIEVWVKGLNFNWKACYGTHKPNRIPLPGYPFAQKRYWIEKVNNFDISEAGVTVQQLHPLVHTNTSDFRQQQFSAVFKGTEFFLEDHQVRLEESKYQKVLPGVAYLEMARVAVAKSLGTLNESIELNDVMWMTPFMVEASKEITIVLFENELTEAIDFEIRSTIAENEYLVHCKGQAHTNSFNKVVKLEVQQLENRIKNRSVKAKELYEIFHTSGLAYGPTHQGIETLFLGENEVMATLKLPAELIEDSTTAKFGIHPSIMDSAFQASIGLISSLDAVADKPSLPFVLESLKYYAPCSHEAVAWIRYAPNTTSTSKTVKLNIDICDAEGNVCIQAHGLISRPLKEGWESSVEKSTNAEEADSLFDESYHKNLIKSFIDKEISLDDIIELV